jgi:hypothetical protein
MTHDPSASPPTQDASSWWDRHLGDMIRHEQDLQRVSAMRAVVLALVATTIAVGGPLLMSGMRWWGGMGWVASLVLCVGFATALGSAVIFWLALAPMEGRGWRPHTLTAWLHQKASMGLGLDFLAGVLPSRTGEWRENLRQARRLRPDLSEKVRAASRRDDLEAHQAHQSAEARELLVGYLRDVVGADLGWWLDPEAAGEPMSAARVRSVFWLWLHRHVAQAMADMLWLGVKLGVTAMFLVLAALIVHWIGWWLLLLLPLIAGLLIGRWAFAQNR